MKNVSLVERLPSVQEYQTLRRAINWKIADEEACKKGLNVFFTQFVRKLGVSFTELTLN